MSDFLKIKLTFTVAWKRSSFILVVVFYSFYKLILVVVFYGLFLFVSMAVFNGCFFLFLDRVEIFAEILALFYSYSLTGTILFTHFFFSSYCEL